MKTTASLRSTVFLTSIIFSTAAGCQEPPLVSAVVREVTHDPNSAPLENRNVPGKQPPSWNVRLEILKVLRGDSKLAGQPMITATADSQPDGNGRFVTPKLNEGDVGIWAIKQLADGSWSEVYSPYDLEKDIRLPIIKGRNDAYEKVLLRLSGGQALEPSIDVKAQEEPTKPTPAASHPPSIQPPAAKKAPGLNASSTPSEEPTSSTPWAIIALLGVAVIRLLMFLLKRRS
jgi:hypothetical protein